MEAAWGPHRCTRGRLDSQTLWPSSGFHSVVSRRHTHIHDYTWENPCVHGSDFSKRSRTPMLTKQILIWVLICVFNMDVSMDEQVRRRSNDASSQQYLFPDDNQDNEWDDDNDQEHQHGSSYRQLRVGACLGGKPVVTCVSRRRQLSPGCLQEKCSLWGLKAGLISRVSR